MAKRKFELNEQERNELLHAHELAVSTRTRQRLRAVRLYGEGRSVTDIMEMTGCSERSLLRWCDAYEQAGIRGLVSGWKGGNNAKLTEAQRIELINRLRQFRPDQVLSPGERLNHAASWTVSDLRIALKRWYGVSWRSDNSYRTLLSEAKVYWPVGKTTSRSELEEQALTTAASQYDNGEDELLAYVDDLL